MVKDTTKEKVKVVATGRVADLAGGAKAGRPANLKLDAGTKRL